MTKNEAKKFIQITYPAATILPNGQNAFVVRISGVLEPVGFWVSNKWYNINREQITLNQLDEEYKKRIKERI